MNSIQEEIINFINNSKKKSVDYNTLCDFLINNGLLKENEVIEVIDDLLEHMILFNRNGYLFVNKDKFLEAVIDKSPKGNLYIIYNDVKYDLKENNLNGALAYDKVLFTIEDDEAVVYKVVERTNPNIVCQIQKSTNGKVYLEPKKIKGKLNIKVPEETLKKIGLGSYVLVKVTTPSLKKSCEECNAEIIKKIVLDGHIDDKLALIAFANDFDIEFPQEVLEEEKLIPDKVSEEEIKTRKNNDFRHDLVFTIDGVNAKDMDDAVGIKILPNGNYELSVHIANVSHYLKKLPACLKESRKRGTSVYMLNTVIPMLCEKLSNGICSLVPNENRLTKSVIMEIDHEGNVVDSRICDGVINSKKKMTYEDVNKILEENIVPDGYEPFVDALKQMNALSKILTAKRLNDGQLTFASREVEAELDENNNPVAFEKRESLSAEKLIENFMITANETVASYVGMMNLPFVYRVHEGPNKIKLEQAIKIIQSIGISLNDKELLKSPRMIKKILDEVKNRDEYPILSNILLGPMSRAKYATKNNGHFALALLYYTHFTSPIRRFPDLMVHFLLDYYNDMSLGNVPFDPAFLKDLEITLEKEARHCSYKERQADLAEQEAERIKEIEYMKNYIGEEFSATIDMISERGISIITDEGFKGNVDIRDILGDTFRIKSGKYQIVGENTKKKLKIGNRIRVILKSVDEIEMRLHFLIDPDFVLNNSSNKVLTK